MSSDYLKVEFPDHLTADSDTHIYRVTPLAGANTKIITCSLQNSQKISRGGDVKEVYQLSFNLGGVKPEFLPGDTIGVLPSNDRGLIERIFLRLNVEKLADKACELKVWEKTLKKNAAIPKHLPPTSSLRRIFLEHVDVHTPPKKLFLKALARFAQDSQELATLQELSSPKSSGYTQFVKTTGSLWGLLEAFPSCTPPVELLLEHLPPLLPRPYSISSSPNLEITFFVLEKDDGTKGLCTSWLQNLPVGATVPLYFRKPSSFQLDGSSPVICIATGTGVAPFRSFFKRGSPCLVWLFYGCRYHDRDFLFREEIKEWHRVKLISKLDVVCSRDSETKRYVQHAIREHSEEFQDWVLNKEARIYICGGGRTVSDVKTTLGDLGFDVEAMEREGRLVVDSWG